MKFDKSKITEKGILEYRMPNISEGYFFLSAITSVQISTMGDAFKIKGSFIPEMKNLVNWAGLGYQSYDDFLDDIDNNFVPVKEIADEIFTRITAVLVKKRSSSMPSVQPSTVSSEMTSSN